MANADLIKKRFDELEQKMAQVGIESNEMGRWVSDEPFHEWATSVLNLLAMAFGPQSAHLKNFRRLYDDFNGAVSQLEAARGIFRAAKSDFLGGYVFSVEASISAEIFSDFIALAKQALAEGHKDVAAVLASASLEDTLKKYAALNEIEVDDKVMQSVVGALKSKGLVGGAQKSLLETMPKIRDYAMHANWSKITAEDVSSIIGFTEQFLLSHF